MASTTDHGTDIDGYTDLDGEDHMVSGRGCLAKAIVRRITTPRNRLIDDPNYGVDLPGYLNSDMTAREIAALQSIVESEIEKDERIASADVTIAVGSDDTATVSILLTDLDGPFSLVLSVDQVTVSILTVGP